MMVVMDSVQEIWRDAPGMLGIYEISNRGRLRRSKPGKNTWPGRIINPGVHGDYGHRFVVRTGESGKPTKFYIHRLVALAFIGQPPLGKPMVRHIDGDGGNNTVENLAWADAAENSLDVLSMGRNVNAVKTQCKSGHEFTPENTVLYDRSNRGLNPERICKQCQVDRRHVSLSEDDPRHGTRNGYLRGQCRCEPCKEAKLEYDRAWREKNRNKTGQDSKSGILTMTVKSGQWSNLVIQ